MSVAPIEAVEGREGHRSGASALKTRRFLALLCRPQLTRSLWRIDRLEELEPARLRAAGIRGVLLDADGTLAPHHVRAFTPEVIAAVQRLSDAGIRLGIYTNASDEEAFGVLAAPLLPGLPAKPSPGGFLEAAARLELPPEAVAMVGDSYITDGGAVEVGMRFIYCRPLPGAEPLGHKLTRGLAAAAARLFDRLRV